MGLRCGVSRTWGNGYSEADIPLNKTSTFGQGVVRGCQLVVEICANALEEQEKPLFKTPHLIRIAVKVTFSWNDDENPWLCDMSTFKSG